MATQISTRRDPYQNASICTPSDSTSIETRAIWVGTVGDVAVQLTGDTAAVTLSAVPAGTLLPICCQKVLETGTTTLMNIVLLS